VFNRCQFQLLILSGRFRIKLRFGIKLLFFFWKFFIYILDKTYSEMF